MLEKIQKRKKQLFGWLGIIAVLYAMTFLQVPMIARNVFLVLATSYGLWKAWECNSITKWEVFILLIGLLARIVFCYLDVFTEFQLPIGGDNDGKAFMHTAVEYYNGDFHRQYTRYPYVILAIFKIIGVNQFAAQYVNVLCWGFGAVVLQKFLKRLDISKILRVASVIVIAWLPTNIWITSILYRDTIIMLLLFLSLYWLICWMQEKKNIYICGVIGPIFMAALLHGASIMSLIPVAVVMLFYSTEKKEFNITKKKVIILFSIFAGIGILFLIPKVSEVLLRKIPSMEEGLVVGLNRYLEGKYDFSEGAGSNYLEDRYLTSYFDIIIMTIQRIYYHMFYPVPHEWNGIRDIIIFGGSSAIIYLITTIFWFVSLFYKKNDAYRFTLFIYAFVTIGVYAWGNVNGGTAIRHREKILGLMVLMAVYSLNIILQKRKECKNCEKHSEN